MLEILGKYAVPFLAGIGSLVVLIFIAAKFFGIKLKFPKELQAEAEAVAASAEEWAHTHHREERRRTSDVLIDNYLQSQNTMNEFRTKQIFLIDKLADIQEGMVEFLKDHHKETMERFNDLERLKR